MENKPMFDVAVSYLDEIDFKGSVYDEKKQEVVYEAIVTEKLNKQFGKYKNETQDDYYANIVFGTALKHILMKLWYEKSFFDVAKVIIENRKEYISTNVKVYPTIMINDWNKYCDKIKKTTNFLEDELRISLFHVAYHYVVDKV